MGWGVADKITISNGKILLDFSNSLQALGATNVNSLAAGDHIHDEFVYSIRLANGTLSQAKVTVDLYGENDQASISGTSSGDVTEDTTPSASGTLTVVDPDHGQSHTQTATNAASDHGLGTYSVDADGNWTYDVDNALIQHLGANDTAQDTFTVTSADGTASQQVTITIHGTNDAPVVSGAVSGSAIEDGSTSTLDALANASDVDDNTTLSVVDLPQSLPAGVGYDAQTHSFTLDPTDEAFQHLAQGQQTTVGVDYSVSDGLATTAASVSWTVTGTNDPATFSGDDTGSVTEAGAGNNGGSPTASGTLTVSDPDDGQSSFQDQNNAATTYGHFTLGSDGSWSYTLDNSNATVNALNNGQTLHDLIGVQSVDGTPGTIDITINGATDDLGGPTGIGFSMNPQSGNSLAALGTFFQTGDPDSGDTFTYSIGAGSASGFVLTPTVGGASLDASGAAVKTDDLLNIVATDAAGNATTVAFHVWIGDNGDNTHTALFSTNNIDDGRQGSDTLNGSSGTDYLFGGSDVDILLGNGGADFLVGGNGNDIFKYGATGDSTAAAHDLILDFSPGSDKIDLSAIDANLISGGDQAFTFDSVQNSGVVAGHVTWFQDAAHNETVVHAGVVGDGTLEIHLAGTIALTAASFTL